MMVDDDICHFSSSNRVKDMRKGYLKWTNIISEPLEDFFFWGKKLVTLPTQANCETIELFMSDRYFFPIGSWGSLYWLLIMPDMTG